MLEEIQIDVLFPTQFLIFIFLFWNVPNHKNNARHSNKKIKLWHIHTIDNWLENVFIYSYNFGNKQIYDNLWQIDSIEKWEKGRFKQSLQLLHSIGDTKSYQTNQSLTAISFSDQLTLLFKFQSIFAHFPDPSVDMFWQEHNSIIQDHWATVRGREIIEI